MKKLLFIALLAITSLGANAQPPMQRPMPNQFRDFVDFKMNQEKPKVEHKDGKVIITMTEERFKMMQRMRMQQRPGFQHASMLEQGCPKCKHHPGYAVKNKKRKFSSKY